MENSVASYFVGVPGGLVMSMIAFSIVFIVIIGLMFLMMGLKHICSAIDGSKKTAAPAPSSAKAAPQASAPAKAVAAPAEDDGELMAVISAAIMAMCGASARIVSFAPVKAPVATSWKLMGRVQNSEGFQD